MASFRDGGCRAPEMSYGARFTLIRSYAMVRSVHRNTYIMQALIDPFYCPVLTGPGAPRTAETGSLQFRNPLFLFLPLFPRNPLKSLKMDERIQGNPKKSKFKQAEKPQ